jgi:hypothetical protein
VRILCYLRHTILDFIIVFHPLTKKGVLSDLSVISIVDGLSITS